MSLSRWGLKVQIDLRPSTWAVVTAISHLGGLTLPSLQRAFSESYRGQSRQYTEVASLPSAMFVAALLLTLQAAKPADKPSLTFYQGALVYRKGLDVRRLLLTPSVEEPKLSVSYRRNARYAVWDERGLTTRDGKKVRSSFLEEIAVSPKAQSRAYLVETVALIKKGVRSKKASALSGSRIIGSSAYFVPRWVDKEGNVWLEALVRVDLSKRNPKPELLMGLSGHSTATKPLDDALTLYQGKLALITSLEDKWGLATFDPANSKQDFLSLGANLQQYLPGGLFVEKTDYGTCLVGKVDLATGDRQTLAESRGDLRLVDGDAPGLAIETSATGVTLRNLDSGAVANVPVGSQVGRMGDLVAIWSPKAKPVRAAVYQPERWTAVARLGTK
ncbi:hypothetical protein BH11ARM2_BH11ARM2_04230 [soil metagenome]